ncbi:hypothetical protein [Paracidovorax citrulli]|uniref:hypothetical protein n=1 Tax=Paracidovorax citrulli TaxID=80869 RepID=UPI000B0A85B5|nr:hypothetical protein [Paracidovorax citrulli]QCX13174.1 hypothetical protein APS58_p00030 [Paracidovorax citrulli]
MKNIDSISSGTLCAILSAQIHNLNSIELAIRQAIENNNTTDEIEVIKSRACVDSTLQFKVSNGKVTKI